MTASTINRISAWCVGTRNMIKALCYSLAEPVDTLKELEHTGNYTHRLALLEELKTMPFGAVWNYYCRLNDVVAGDGYIKEIQEYQKEVLSKR